MELNALTRWESIGKDLYAKGQLGHEIERIKQFSQMLSAARKRHRHSSSPRRSEEEEKSPIPPFTVQLAPADGGPTIPLGGIIESEAERDAHDSSLDEDEGGHRAFSATSSLPLLYPLSDAKEEERIQDDLEKKELDEIPITHARVSPSTHTLSLRIPP